MSLILVVLICFIHLNKKHNDKLFMSYALKGQEYQNKGKYTKAENEYTKALNIFNKKYCLNRKEFIIAIQVLNNLSGAYFQENNFDKAQDFLKQEIKLLGKRKTRHL